MAYVEHSSGKHSPSLIHLESSRFPRRYGISHSHSSTATRWAISGRYRQEPGDRRRVQSWADKYFHSMGSLCGVFVPTAASSLGHSSRWSFPLGCPLFVTTPLLRLVCPSAYLLGHSSYSRLLKNYSQSTA